MISSMSSMKRSVERICIMWPKDPMAITVLKWHFGVHGKVAPADLSFVHNQPARRFFLCSGLPQTIR